MCVGNVFINTICQYTISKCFFLAIFFYNFKLANVDVLCLRIRVGTSYYLQGLPSQSACKVRFYYTPSPSALLTKTSQETVGRFNNLGEHSLYVSTKLVSSDGFQFTTAQRQISELISKIYKGML